MIHIDYPAGQQPSEDWLRRAAAVTEKLKLAPDKTSRDLIIDENAKLWQELSEWLCTFSNEKCWFTEAPDCGSYFHVEHFRPKKSAREPDRDGYWWLAFDFLNYRLCGGVANSKKGTFFPLREGSLIAIDSSCDHDNEAPLLIDPTVECDVVLITFSEGGIAIPTYGSGWYHERAARSIERYKLNGHGILLRARAKVWKACEDDAKQMELYIAGQMRSFSVAREQKIKDIAKRLKARTKREAPFSSVARAYLMQYPHKWARLCIA